MVQYFRTWLIIKRKQLLNLFPLKENSFTKFAIVCAARSGSTWLHTLLNSHPQIISYGEILRETAEQNPEKELRSLNEIVFHPHHASIQAVGLKVFYEYETESTYKNSFNEILNDKTIRIIHLIRNDKSAQFKSLKQAEKTQVWSSGKPSKKKPVLEIDPTALEKYIHSLLQQEHHIEKLFQHHPVLTIHYEELLNQHAETCVELQKFLQVKPRKLFSLLKKQSA